jgi:putative transposase
MTKLKLAPTGADFKALPLSDEDGFRGVLQSALQEVLEAEMTEALQAGKSERTAGRLAYRSGYYDRKLITRVGVLEPRVPQDRAGRFSTELFERYQRSEKALVSALAEMYVQGVSTRKSLPSGLTRGSWALRSPTGKAGRAGGISCPVFAREACTASSTW